MALTRKFLSAMGIEEDKIEEIIGAHTDTVNGLKEEIDKYKGDSQKLASVQKELAEANKELATAKEAMANGDKSPYKVKYEEQKEATDKLQKEFDDYKADVDAKALLAKKTDAYKKLLKEAGISDKRIDSILKVTKLDDMELEEDGTVKDSSKVVEKIKSEWADFIVDTQTHGASTPNPASNNGGSSATPSLASRLAADYQKNLYGSVSKEG